MDLIVLNQNYEPVCVLDSYESMIWTDRYWECGDFEIHVPMSNTIASNIKQDYYLKNPESEHLMIIEHILINSDYESGNYVTISGRSLESILYRRIIWGSITVSGNLQNAIKYLLDSCIIAPSKNERKIDNFIFEYSSDSTITKLSIKAQYTGDNLYDVISQICKERNIGFKITLNSNKQFAFTLYSGIDRSYNQTNNPAVVFSPVFDNLASSNYAESKANLKNVALIGGEGEGYDRRYASLGVSSGLERRELFVDARDISSSLEDGQTLSETDYIAQLGQRGQEKMNEYPDIVSFEGEAEYNISFKYKKDFFIGDVVQVADEYSHNARSRILEVVISEGESGLQIYPTFKAVDEQNNIGSAEKDDISGDGNGEIGQMQEQINEVQTKLTSHKHNASDINSGIFDAIRLPMGWKKATVTFNNGVGTVSCTGVTVNSTVLAMRAGDYSDTTGSYGFLGAVASSAGVVKLFTGTGTNNPSSWTVYLWWSK